MDQKVFLALILILVILTVALLLMQGGGPAVRPSAKPSEVRFTQTECDSICKSAEYDRGECLSSGQATSDMVKTQPCVGSGSCYCYNEPEAPEAPEEPTMAELYCVGMPLSEAEQIAEGSECTANSSLTDDVFCNNITRTWWIKLDLQREGCNPACVISVDNRTAEINWRCTGLLV